MKKNLFIVVFLLLGALANAQTKQIVQPPKLVIGIVIDQMRWDYLYRYQDLYGKDGFSRLRKEGFSCENTLVPYLPTYTAPGHSSIFTGSVPAINGIVGNDWYDATSGGNMYCTEDSSVSTVGSNSNQGKMSPKNLLVSTVTDELRLSNNFQNKVIGISLKDRGAILPAGHSANAAYWFDNTNGKWISSTYYQQQLPEWMVTYNNNNWVDKAMQQDWNTLLPIEKYTQSTADNKVYERKLEGEESPTFPHKLSLITKSKYEVFKYTPFASTYTFNTAKEIIKNEKMGMGKFTDMLTVSISSTDYMGHAFGPNSIEAEDTYLRLDRDIADFLKYLDATIGQGKYLLFLTADHAAAQVPGFLEEHKIPAGNFSSSQLQTQLKDKLSSTFNLKNAIIKIQNNQVYLDENVIEKSGKNRGEIESVIINFLKEQPMIAFAFSTENISNISIPATIKQMLINGYNPKRSGQIGFVPLPGYIGMGNQGTTHGAWNPYDAHIPLLWFGTYIKPGKTNREVYMTDIAPTLSAILNIQMPNGSIGKVIEEVVK
jgi:predicted AlkP superfamily pyrophosphatase or phosphodiesterase